MTISESERIVLSILREHRRYGAEVVSALAEALRDACAETRRACAQLARDHGAGDELVEAIGQPRRRRWR